MEVVGIGKAYATELYNQGIKSVSDLINKVKNKKIINKKINLI